MMKARWLVLLAALLSLVLAGCIATDAPDPLSQDEAPAPPTTWFENVHHPDEIAERVEAYDAYPTVHTAIIGTSFEDRPIHRVTLGHGDFDLWMVGRMHGDEPTGGEAILLAIETLADPDASLPEHAPSIVHALHDHRDEILDRITFHFIPVANPDGAATYQRETMLGVDANRDNYLFTQDETTALREAFWEVTPDACLDLHNHSPGATDFDAYGPEGPFMEDEPFQRMLKNVDLAVREVDAAGGNAGRFNEFYTAPEPADDYPNPTSFHPGTHDMFCTARGAPGWTPETSVTGGENGIDTPHFEWSTRLHLATIAATAFDWAGAYDATEPTLWTQGGDTAPLVQHTVDIQEASDVTLQAVWRQTDAGGDHNPTPTTFTVTTPEGDTHEGRAPTPEAWTSTVVLPDADAGTYTLTLAGAPAGLYEMRSYAQPPGTPLIDVDRTQDTIEVHALQDAPEFVTLTLTDVADETTQKPTGDHPLKIRTLEGSIGNRTVATLEATLSPGDNLTVTLPEAWTGHGPYRFTASAGDVIQTGVEDTRNPWPGR